MPVNHRRGAPFPGQSAFPLRASSTATHLFLHAAQGKIGTDEYQVGTHLFSPPDQQLNAAFTGNGGGNTCRYLLSSIIIAPLIAPWAESAPKILRHARAKKYSLVSLDRVFAAVGHNGFVVCFVILFKLHFLFSVSAAEPISLSQFAKPLDVPYKPFL